MFAQSLLRHEEAIMALWCEVVEYTRRAGMIKVKTFTSEIKVFHTVRELAKLDEMVNAFIQEAASIK